MNSRSNKKAPIVWRRRQGVQSGITFTTYERPALSENKKVSLPDGSTDTFNLGKLILSIAAAFSHDEHSAQYDSLWLAETIEDKLSMQWDELTPKQIAHTTHETLRHFDELAAVQYAARHHMLTTIRRRGKLSFS